MLHNDLTPEEEQAFFGRPIDPAVLALNEAHAELGQVRRDLSHLVQLYCIVQWNSGNHEHANAVWHAYLDHVWTARTYIWFDRLYELLGSPWRILPGYDEP